jgi:hypothetical protein
MKLATTLMLFMLCGLVHAQGSVRQESPQSINTSSPTTTWSSTAFGSAVLVGSTIEVWITNDTSASTAAPTSVVDSCSHTYTLQKQINDVTQTQQLLLYTFSNNACNSLITVTATWAIPTAGQGVWTKEIAGVSTTSFQTQAGQLQTSPGATTNAITSGSATPTSQPCLMSAFSLRPSAPSAFAMTSGTGFTSGANGFGNSSGSPSRALSESQHLTSTSAIPATFTDATNGGSGDYMTITAVYSDASSGNNNMFFVIP